MQQFGIGSFNHKILNLPKDQIIPEIVKRENAAELPNLPRGLIEETRKYCIQALLRNRIPVDAPPIEQIDEWIVQKIRHGNAVNIAGWLVLLNDPTAVFLFTDDEKKVLGNYLRDYERARILLVENEVIGISRPLSFTPIPDPGRMFQFMVQSSIEENTALAEPRRGDERERLVLLDREARQGFQPIVIGFRMFVWQKMIQSIYGQRYIDEVNAINAGSEGSRLTTSIIERLDMLHDFANNREERIAFDQLVFADLLHDYIDRTLPESHNDKIMQACSAVFRNEMFYFPPYARYLLRYVIHGQEKAIEALVEDPII